MAAAAMVISLSARAQLTSVDNGAAVTDSNGLMWANTVGQLLPWSSTGAAGSAQAWIANLNATDYGGYSDWTLATGDGSSGANTTTNQLADLFYSDCGNSAGGATMFSNSGKNCTAFSAVNDLISSGKSNVFFSSSLYGTTCCNVYNTYWWALGETSTGSGQYAYNFDTSNTTGQVGRGDALAVRMTPEIDPASTASALTLLLGGIAVIRGRRRMIRS
jgi:hypothetical protein